MSVPPVVPDVNAIAEIPDWEQFEQQLKGFIGKRVRADAVDDIFGDVVLRLLEHRGKLEAVRNPIAWIYRVTANRIADHYRMHSREAVDTGMEADMLNTADDMVNLDDTSQALEELADCVLPLIRHLPTPYSEALMLTEIEGMKQVRAANKLGLTPSGMKSRVQRGRSMLKKSILECCQVSLNRKGQIQDYERKESCC
jgi:RNA polymerase sigma-70 factor, ECF subfamily